MIMNENCVRFENVSSICMLLVRDHYFQKIAFFTDKQLDPKAGYLIKESSICDDISNSSYVFDEFEFSKLKRNQIFIDLVLAPLSCVSKFAFRNSKIGDENQNAMVRIISI